MISAVSSSTHVHAWPRAGRALAAVETRRLERAHAAAREARHLAEQAALSALAAREAAAGMNMRDARRLDLFL